MLQNNAIPNIVGQICTHLVLQEFWFEGIQIEQCNVVYLQVDNGAWHRILIDAGVLFWKHVNAPDKWDTVSTDQYHYPQIEMTVQTGLGGRQVKTVITSGENCSVAELRIVFYGGLVLVLHNENDRSTLTVVPETDNGAV